MAYGWEKYRDEGVEEIKRLAASPFFMDKPAQKQILDKYVEIYQEWKERDIPSRCLFDQGPKEDDPRFFKRVWKNTNSLRTSFKKFYDTEEGRASGFELYFIAKGKNYNLGIRPWGEVEPEAVEGDVKKQPPSGSVSYVENHVLETRYSPLLLFAIPAGVFVAVLVLFITGGLFVDSPFLFALILTFAAVVLFISRNLYRLPHWRFAHFFHSYFLRLSDKKIILATYSSDCPECGGDVELTSGFVKGTGYVARCLNNQHSHTFSFDHTSLKGERL